MPRLLPILSHDRAEQHHYDPEKKVDRNEGTEEIDPFTALAVEEQDHDIKYRTLSWQKTTLLLFGEYVCLAILALAWSWSVLGWVCGFFITFGLGIVTWYTSYVLWQFCMKHPEAKDICDIAMILFVIGFHVFTGAKIIVSLPRTLNHVSMMSMVSAIAMFIAIILSLVYAGIEDAPFYGYGGNYPELGPVKTSVGLPNGGPGFVAGLNAVLK
ncbi:hypothetical protein IAU60_001216 [Kwoniella sp. DSM 27419]